MQQNTKHNRNNSTSGLMDTFKTIIWRNLAGLFLTVILCCLLFQQCSEKHRLQGNVTALTTENKIFKNQLGTETIQNARLLLTNDELKKYVIEKDEKIKTLSKGFAKVNTILKTQTITQIDTIKIPFESPVPCRFFREGSIHKDWFSLDYKADSTGVVVENLKIPNEQIIITGFKRKWFFGKQTAITEVTNTNPLVKNVDLKSYETTVPKKWYESKILWLGAGLITGALIVK
jgi:hypothetical protein